MELTLVISDNCQSCRRVEKHLRDILKKFSGTSLKIININNLAEQRITITPALLIEDELFAYGEIDEGKLISKINERAAEINQQPL
ncbi:MAG: thioredoxin family protein [Ignavibacteriaceae bacterium]|jgi:predicted thioredoxin/glutaredoxin|nr:thioredoxin family protein [Ignavibacteriaceae bacterium]